VIASIVRANRDARFEYFVYACEDGVFRREIEEAGTTVRVLPRHLPKFDPYWIVRLARVMRRDGVDLVHAHLFGDSLHGYLAARAAGELPVLLTLHIGVEGLNRLQHLGYRWLVRRADRSVACSEAVRQSFLESVPEAESRLRAVPNGIEVPPPVETTPDERRRLRQSLGLDPDAVIVAALGRLVPQKAFDLLISAFARLSREEHRSTRLVLLGEGPDGEALARHAEQQGVGDRVVLAGFRPDVYELLEVIDVVVFSSLFEGLPVALLEAMAMARCIVATDVPGMVEAVRGEREAVIVPRGDVGELSKGLERVLQDAELREHLGREARRRFVQEFTAEKMVERYEETYLELGPA
jgi:glycosyltransferase involved in cell wall biosynthesis